LVIYGGEHVARTPLSEEQALWVCHDNGQQWHCVTPFQAPPPRIAHAQAVYQNDIYIFGGRAGITMQEQAMNDLWKLDCSGPPGSEVWHEVKDMQGTIPPARSFHRMICVGDALYVFGGCGVAGRLHDLYRFDIPTNTWSECPVAQLAGRGGPNFVTLQGGRCLLAVAGFCGHETNDAQVYSVEDEQWLEQGVMTLSEMRPRSVCVAGSFPSMGVVVIFGGEVDPSDRGHEGAGGFANDLVLLDEATGEYRETIPATENDWPETRGWSAGDVHQNALYVFGGLSGDDASPRRLDDLWKLELVRRDE
jgi:N-acetylneuraminic acid mutarotase